MTDFDNLNDVQPQAEVSDDSKLWALLSWILTPFVPIIVLLLEDKREVRFIKYNAIQALVVGAIGYILTTVLSAVLIGCFIGIAVLAYTIFLGIKAYQGNWVTVPVVTEFCANQGWIEGPSA